MKKLSSTRHSLLMSVLAVFLCVTMLIGTTFAWFTDTATSGVNKIQAGNLDIEVSYEKTSGNWASIEGVSSLFSSSKWEPGHTEFVTLKIENKGTLALKYQINVSPISETGGINQAGESFKLSDYLVFGTSDPAASAPAYTKDNAGRTAARAAVGTTQKLTQANLSKSGTMEAGADAQYVTLVIYMPESVGNVANHKTGTTAPYIDLGITVVATQKDSESDSFNNEYDKDVDYDPADGAIVYNYFPQIDVTGQLEIDGTEVKKGSTAGSETEVTKLSETTSKVILASQDKIESNTAAKLEVVVDKGELQDDETGSLTLKVVKDDTANANFQATQTSEIDTEKQDSTTYQVSVKSEGVVPVAPATDKAKFKVDLFIGKNRSNVKMYHKGTLMTEATTGAPETFSYDASTGYVTMYVDEFSPFTAVYDLPVAAIGTTVYYTVQDAVNAAGATATTIKLLCNASGDGVDVAGNQNIIFDFCGYTYTLQGEMVGSSGTKTNGFRFLQGSTVTMKNGKLANGATTAEGNTPAKVMVNSYATLTLKDFSIDATTAAVAPSGSPYGTGCLYIANGPAIVTGTGTYTGDPDGYAIYMANVEYYTAGAALTFDEYFTGTVSGKITDGGKQAASIQIKSGYYNFGTIAFTDGTMSITGGTFSADPSTPVNYVADGYKAKANGTTPETWTVKAKDVPKPVDGVFSVANTEQLNEVIEELNSPDTSYNSGEYTIKLGAGVFGGTEVEGGWKADVCLIKQYPEWNGCHGNSSNGNNFNTSMPANHRQVTIIGNDSPTERTELRIIFVVAGFGYSGGGNPGVSDDDIRTVFQNIDFDFTNCVGVNYESSTNIKQFGNTTDGFSPILACAASSNLIVDNCNFTKVNRIKVGYAQNVGNSTWANILDDNGEVCLLAGHVFDPVVKNCTFTDCDTCIDGYFEKSDKAELTNITFTGGQAFVNSQGSCLNTVMISNCTVECANYFIRTNSGSKFHAKGCTIDVTDTNVTQNDANNKVGLITFRGNNNIITLEDCTLDGSKEINCCNNGSDITSVVTMKGTSPTASEMIKTTKTGTDCTIEDYDDSKESHDA